MGTITVAGFDTPSILAAQTAAGAGGKLLFPAGVYDANGLTANVADQIWIMERYATLLRNPASTGATLTLQVNGLCIIGGTIDGNKANSTNAADGIDSTDFSLTCEDMTLQNVANWGFAINEGMLILRRCLSQNVGLGDVIWRTQSEKATFAPVIDECTFDKSMLSPSTAIVGNVLIQAINANNTQFATGARVTRSKFLMPWSPSAGSNIEGIECRNCERGWIADNRFVGGGSGYSNAQSGLMEVRGNVFQGQSTYAIEVGGNDSLYADNKGTGYAPSLYGIFANPVTLNSAAIGNHFTGYTQGGIVNQAGANFIEANNW